MHAAFLQPRLPAKMPRCAFCMPLICIRYIIAQSGIAIDRQFVTDSRRHIDRSITNKLIDQRGIYFRLGKAKYTSRMSDLFIAFAVREHHSCEAVAC